MKKLKKIIIIVAITIILLCISKIIIYRTISSNNIKAYINEESSTLYNITWKNISIVNNTIGNFFYIPLNGKKQTIKVTITDNNGEKRNVINMLTCDRKENNSINKNGCLLNILTKESIMWVEEYRIPMCVSSNITNDSIEIDLWNTKWYYLENVYIKKNSNERIIIDSLSKLKWLWWKTKWIYLNISCKTWNTIDITLLK